MISVTELKKKNPEPELEVEILVQIELYGGEHFLFFQLNTSMDTLEEKIIYWGLTCNKTKTVKVNNYKKLKSLINSDSCSDYDRVLESILDYICCRQELSILYVNNYQGYMNLTINIYDQDESLTEIDNLDDEAFMEFLDILRNNNQE